MGKEAEAKKNKSKPIYKFKPPEMREKKQKGSTIYVWKSFTPKLFT